ncbi:hypothetical protein [Desulfomonile tiedjei]|uniref:Uncharacterized protein n=1 Tax=Desulfomonile tiedjei (strain ATCC 49306 / DSM 6799 / DCB-1) TaxID=706587 RepID=I4C7D0_DESTA|nr:hypothetical protein [Desulfomonile tiedjei]AFM25471.1 hypothetical protein Desti_2801 [Desulfomonile tiedjei DSM 6799]
MSGKCKMLGLVMLLGLGVTVHAWAVGYERLEVDATKTRTNVVSSNGPAASIAEKCPALLDEVAGVITDLLSQFGIINKKAP